MKVLSRDEFNAQVRSLKLNERDSQEKRHVRMHVTGNGFQGTQILTDINLTDAEITYYRTTNRIQVGDTLWAIKDLEIVG